VAKHYGVSVAICPPRRGNRKGVVEKANHVAAQRFWRTLADDVTVEEAQRALDRWCTRRGDTRMRATADGKATVATLAAAEPLAAVPAAAFPAQLVLTRKVSAQALVAYRGNFYSVAPELARGSVTVRVRLGAGHLDICTAAAGSGSGGGGRGAGSAAAVVLARHRLAPPGAGVMVRDHGHVLALETAAMAASCAADGVTPHRRKTRIPPGQDAVAAARALRAKTTGGSPTAPGSAACSAEPPAPTDPPTGPSRDAGPADHAGSGAPVIDLARYAAAAAGRNTLTP